jgi:hypothetical protein
MVTRGPFPGRKAERNVNHSPLVPRSIIVELNFHSPILLHGVMLNKLSTRTALPFTLILLVLDVQPILVARLSATMLRCVAWRIITDVSVAHNYVEDG